MLIFGTLPGICYAGGMTSFLYSRQVRIFDYPKDYALITRVVESSGGKALVVLCGITTFGTQAAAEFVTSEERLQGLFARAPQDWKNGNLQAVISMRVKDDVPGPPKLEAAWFW